MDTVSIFRTIAVSALAALLCSCSGRDADRGRAPEDAPSLAASFSCAPETKAQSADTVRSLDLLVFRAGHLQRYARSASQTVYAELPSNTPLSWHIVANAPEGAFTAVTQESQYLALLSEFSHNASAYVMAGAGSGTLVCDTALTVSVDRLACCVTLGSVAPQFLSSMYQGVSVTFDGIYLINVDGTCPYSRVPASGELWYNRLSFDTSLPEGIASVLYAPVGKALKDTSSVTGPWRFVCMPNPVNNGVDSRTQPQWSPRNTRLVVQFDIGGVKNYYPATMPAMACNREYRISRIVLAGPGSGNPDIPVERDSMQFTVKVEKWIPDKRVIDF